MSAATSKSAARGGRALIMVAGLLCAAAALVGGASASSLALCTTTTSAPTATPSSTVAGTPITYTATVTASSGCANGSPTGTVAFFSNYVVGGQPTSFQIGSPTTLQPSATPGQSVATLVDNSLPAGTFAITASYTSSNESLFFDSGPSAGTSVVIQSNALHTTVMNFTENPSTLVVGQTVTFHAQITAVDTNGNPTGTIPTGTVDLSAGPTAASGQVHFASVDLDSTGSFTYSYGGFVPGDYIIIASYTGDPVDQGISGQLPLTVLPSSSSIATSTAVTASPGSISAGDSSTFTAHVVETATQTPPPAGGTVDFFAGTNSTNLDLEGVGTLDANGNAQLSAANFTPGSYDVRAQYLGDSSNNISGSSGDTTLLVSTSGSGGNPTTTATQLAYTGAVEATYGTQATLSGQLVEGGGGALAGEPLTLTMGSQSCTTGLTDGSGNASCQITVTQSAGQYPVTATFAGDSNWTPSSGSGTFTVDPAATTLTYDGATTAAYGADATLSATLKDPNGNPVAGESVHLTMGSQSCDGVTDSNGEAACTITVSQAPGPYPIAATFGGDGNYSGSSASGTFTVTAVPTSTTYTGDTQGAPNAPATLSATLTDSHGSPIAGETVTLTLGSQHCTATTDANGKASCTITISQPAGTYAITASFAGDGGYLASQATGTFTVVSSATVVHVASVPPVLVGSTVSLGGTLLAGGSPLPGKTLTLSLGSQSCTGTTSVTGAASCSVTASGPLGPTPVKAAFAGDATYKPASATGSTYVYALTPGGGSFVVGDKTDTGSVTFWGAQWSKLNSLSGTPAPDSFKGFALYPSTPQCGVPWSTDPGNSAPPPAGPLPAYMAVIVTSAAAKAGPTIFGNTVAIVIVQTNAGYKNDPGHAGTGTVVATLCTGSPVLNKPATKTTYTGATQSTTGTAATLSATLTDANGNPVANETVTLTMGSQSCTGKTDPKGNVSCSITITQAAGSYPVTATFAGDAGYAGSTGSSSFTVSAPGLCQAKGAKCESLLADPSVNGSTLSIVYMDDTPINASKPPTAVLNGQSLHVTVTPTFGKPQNYVDRYGGSTSTRYESLLTFTLPSGLAPGTYTVVVTAYDSDGDFDQYAWSVTVGSTNGGNGGGSGGSGGGGCQHYGI